MKPSSRFKRILSAAEDNAEIIPVLYGYLEGGKLPDPFTVGVRGGSGERAPDGWFHPSTHPLMGERQLFFYLTSQPSRWEPEPFDYTSKMSALVGSMVHDVVETALQDLGYLIVPKGTCQACGQAQPSECKEHGASDRELKSRGHLDGILGLGERMRGFEFKTAMPFVLTKIRSNDLEAFREKWPYYYAQVQEYMRMTGLREFKVVFWAMGNPWDMREFTVPFDPMYSLVIETKYRNVREAVALNEMPAPCDGCGFGTAMASSCPALDCPIKGLR